MNPIRYVLAATLLVSACTSYPLRDAKPESNNPPCQVKSLNKECAKSVVFDGEESHSLVIVEANKKGEVAPESFENAISLLKKYEDQSKVVVVFVHGWHHSARFKDPNLSSFNNTLKALHAVLNPVDGVILDPVISAEAREAEIKAIGEIKSETQFNEPNKRINPTSDASGSAVPAANQTIALAASSIKVPADLKQRKVIGIYLGWPADAWGNDWRNVPTFWSTKKRSIKVGQNGLRELLNKVQDTLDAQQQRNKGQSNMLVSVGHSFGGSALFNAVGNQLKKNILEAPEQGPVRGVGAMTILVNPAIEANQFTGLRNAIYEKRMANEKIFEKNIRPVFLSIGSANDNATKILFPIARLKSWLGKPGKTQYVKDVNHPEKPAKFGRWLGEMQTIGHFQPYVSHWLNLVRYPSDDLSILKYCQPMPNWISRASLPIAEPTDPQSDCKGGTAQTFDTCSINLTEKRLPFRIANRVVKSGWWSGVDKERYRSQENGSIDQTWRDSPFWFVRATGGIIGDHNDMWDRSSGCMVLQLILADTTGGFDDTKTKEQTLEQTTIGEEQP